jgi:hypothetical protein
MPSARPHLAPPPTPRPMDPRDRLRLCGPIRPMARPASLIERLLFG